MTQRISGAAPAPVSANPTLGFGLADVDPQVYRAIAAELNRQESTLEMIASENFAPQSVMEAQGSVLTNKYAEGYPGRRYYGGCEHVDVIEQLAIDRVKALFGASTPTCNHIRAPRPTPRRCLRCCSPGTRFWVRPSTMAVTSPTG